MCLPQDVPGMLLPYTFLYIIQTYSYGAPDTQTHTHTHTHIYMVFRLPLALY